MAEALGLVASIVAVLQLTTSVVQYTRDVADSNSYKKRLLLEVGGTKGILETLKDLASDVNDDDPILHTVHLLQVPLQEYTLLLRSLESKLASAQGLKKIGKVAKWPFEKSDVLEIFAALERYKALFSLSLQADHIELSKAIQHQLDSVQDYNNEQELRELLKWLSPLPFASKHQAIFSKHQEGTGRWLLEDDTFVEWENGQSRLLWCPGVPGAGKTVFASIVVDDYLMAKFKNDNIAVLGIYCDYKEFNQQSTAKYIASLLQQLILQRESVPEDVKSAHRAHSRNQTSPSLPELLELMEKQLVTFDRVCIVIDALDECTEINGVRDELLEGVLQLPDFTSLMVTSRYIPGLDEYFENALKLPIRAHEDDIHLHVRNCLAKEKTWVRRIRLDARLQTKISNSIVERACGMFLLAQLHLSSIVKKHSRKDIEKALTELPEGLNSTYNQIMQRIDDQAEEDTTLAREVLSWLTYARRPMSAFELQQALAIKPQDTTFDEDALIHEETFLGLCAGLVVIDPESHIIHFVHYTAQEYFVQCRGTAFPFSPLNIVTTCLTFLLFDEQTKQSMPDLYTYVADNWGHHARESPETAELVGKIVVFVRDERRLLDCVRRMSIPQSTFDVSNLMQGLHLAAKFDLVMTMVALIDTGKFDVNAQDDEGRTPLYYAAGAVNGDVATLLLDRPDVKIDLPSYFHGTPLHNAILSSQNTIVKMLLNRRANYEAKNSYGERPTHLAVKLGQSETLETLLGHGVNVTATTNSGHTPLELALPMDSKLRQKTSTGLWRSPEVTASKQDYQPCLRLLLDALTKEDIDRSYMLFEAVKDGRPDIVQLLLEKGARTSIQNKTFNRRTPLHWAAEKGFEGSLKILLAHGSDPQIQDNRGFTPLHYASSAERETIVKLLLPTMTDVNIRAKNGLTPLQEARLQGHTTIVDLLIQAGAENLQLPDEYEVSRDDIEKRHAGNFKGKLYVRSRPIEAVQDPPIKTLSGQVVTEEEYKRHAERLIVSAGQGDVEGVLLCLSKGVWVSERDHEHNKTALHWAAENGHKDISELLLKWGSTLCCQDQYGESPLHYAAENGHTEIVEIMLSHDAVDQTFDLNLEDDRGRTALRCARDNYHLNVVQVFLDKRPHQIAKDRDSRKDIDIGGGIARSPLLFLQETDKQGKTVMHWAAELGDIALLESLCKLQPSIAAFQPDHRGWTPLRYAERHQNQAVAQVVQRFGRVDLETAEVPTAVSQGGRGEREGGKLSSTSGT